jgi:hypothetical protein
MTTLNTTGRATISARFAGFEGPATAVELGVGVAMGVELKIVSAGTGNGWEGRGGCTHAMWRVCRTKDLLAMPCLWLNELPAVCPYNLPSKPPHPYVHNMPHND